MSKPFESYEEIRIVIYDILAVLTQHGINTVSLGGIMRMLGVPSEVAAAHDDEYFHVTVDALSELEDEDITIPPGTTIH